MTPSKKKSMDPEISIFFFGENPLKSPPKNGKVHILVGAVSMQMQDSGK
jgi:hypothetical protein